LYLFQILTIYRYPSKIISHDLKNVLLPPEISQKPARNKSRG
jgi:hypothetical protein